MGYLCGIHCDSCGYSKTFRLGCGRKDYEAQQIYSHFELMDEWSVKVMALEKGSAYLTFRYRLGKCSDCGQLLEVPEVLFEDGTAFHGKCCSCDPKTEHEITLYEGESDMLVSCPQCGREVRSQIKGLWD